LCRQLKSKISHPAELIIDDSPRIEQKTEEERSQFSMKEVEEVFKFRLKICVEVSAVRGKWVNA